MAPAFLELLMMLACAKHVSGQGAPGGGGGGGGFVPGGGGGDAGGGCTDDDDDCGSAAPILIILGAVVFCGICAAICKAFTDEDVPDAATYISEGPVHSQAAWPSGTWRGYYKQFGNRSHTLCDFSLNFSAATQSQSETGSRAQPRLSGSGVDTVGQYNITGIFENYRLAFQKHYILDSPAVDGRVNRHMNKGHTVEYRGEVVDRNLGQGVKGTWYIQQSSSGYQGKGAFHLWPAMADWNRMRPSAPPAADAAPQFHVTSDNVCVVCAERPINVCLRPCNHVAVCGQCANQLRPSACPICRGAISSITTQGQRRSVPQQAQQAVRPARQPRITNPMSEPAELAGPLAVATNV